MFAWKVMLHFYLKQTLKYLFLKIILNKINNKSTILIKKTIIYDKFEKK